MAVGRALGDRLVVGQELDRAVEPAGALERAHEAGLPVEQRRALRLGDR